MNTLKNIYIYFTAKDFRYTAVEAVDDDGNRFAYTFDEGSHEAYLRSAKHMCEQFEKFCEETCGLYDARYCDIWAIDCFSPLPDDFDYESLFDKSTINTKDYERNFEIYTEYINCNLDSIIGKCGYACVRFLSTQYGIKCNHIKSPEAFETFLEKNLSEQSADGVRSVFVAYKKHIDKNNFTADELANVRAYMLKNIDVIFEVCDRRTVITREKRIIYEALFEAAMRLYEFDNTAFQEIIHKLLETNTKSRRADSAVYAFIFNFIWDFADKNFEEPFEGVLSDYTLPTDFCSAEDKIRIQEVIRREEGGL